MCTTLCTSDKNVHITDTSELAFSVFYLFVQYVKICYNEQACDRPVLFVIAIIHYNHEDLCTKLTI